jgi:hypothetical protein
MIQFEALGVEHEPPAFRGRAAVADIAHDRRAD